jgi:hypothetical protein
MMFLNVPYAEKDEARGLGARWNPAKKRWYVPDGVAPEPFARWAAKDGAAPGEAGTPASRDSRAAAPVVGARFLKLDHECNPFESCPECAPVLAQSGWAQARADVLEMLRKSGR